MTHLPWAYSDPIDGQGMDDEDRGYSEPLRCDHCGEELDYEECDQCEDGYSGHDCGEDYCACLDPEPNERCEQCSGKGGWHLCRNRECPGKQAAEPPVTQQAPPRDAGEKK